MEVRLGSSQGAVSQNRCVFVKDVEKTCENHCVLVKDVNSEKEFSIGLTQQFSHSRCVLMVARSEDASGARAFWSIALR